MKLGFLILMLAVISGTAMAEPAAGTAEVKPESKAALLSNAARSDQTVKPFVEEIPMVKTTETASGEVTRMEGGYINVLYGQTETAEYELYIPMDENVKLEYYKKTADIQPGDQIELEYEKTVMYPDMPQQQITMSVKKIRFVSSVKKENELVSEANG